MFYIYRALWFGSNPLQIKYLFYHCPVWNIFCPILKCTCQCTTINIFLSVRWTGYWWQSHIMSHNIQSWHKEDYQKKKFCGSSSWILRISPSPIRSLLVKAPAPGELSTASPGDQMEDCVLGPQAAWSRHLAVLQVPGHHSSGDGLHAAPQTHSKDTLHAIASLQPASCNTQHQHAC